MFLESIKKLLFGFGAMPEYVPIDEKLFQKQLCVTLTDKNGNFWDVSERHLMLGYNPMLFSVFAKQESLPEWVKQSDRVSLQFTPDEFKPGKKWRSYPTAVNTIVRIE